MTNDTVAKNDAAYAIALVTPRYCPVTDALIGERVHLLTDSYGTFSTLGRACAKRDAVANADSVEDPEVCYAVVDAATGRRVYARPPVKAAPAAAVDFQDGWI